MVKLLDYKKDWPALEASANIFASVVMVHLRNLETADDPQSRNGYKISLMRSFYDKGYSPQQIRDLYNLIDAMMALPKDLEEQFLKEIYKLRAC